jgi:hypothetical protein
MKLLRRLLVFVGVLVFSILCGLTVLGFLGDRPGEFATSLATIGGIVAGLTGLTLGLAQSLEGDERARVNREARNLFSGTLFWFYGAFVQYLLSIQRLPPPLVFAMFGVMTALVGVLMAFASFYTAAAVAYLLEFLSDPTDLARAEQARKDTSRNPLERLLNR